MSIYDSQKRGADVHDNAQYHSDALRADMLKAGPIPSFKV